MNFNSLVPGDSQFLPAAIPSSAFDLQIVEINQVISVLYVGGGQLVSSGQMDINVGSVKNDTNSYPFTRLSSFLSRNGKLYLYHQLNSSTIAESVYDPEGTWSTNPVNVSG